MGGYVISDVSVLSGCSSSLAGCTVLFHGPAGSGKVTVVSAASRRLNLHLLKVRRLNAHTLVLRGGDHRYTVNHTRTRDLFVQM